MTARKHEQVDTRTLELLPLPVVLFNDQQIFYLNERANRLLGLPQKLLAHISEVSIYDFIDKSLHKEIRQNNKLILQGQDISLAEFEFTNYRGKRLVIEAHSTAVFFGGKKVIQAVFMEISARKSLLNESEAAKDILHKISASSIDVIFHFSFSPSLRLKYISDSSKNVLGFQPQELSEDPELISERLHEEDRRFLVISKKGYLKLTEEERRQKLLVRFKHKNGHLKYLEVAINPVFDKEKGDLLGLIGNMRDVTDRIEAETLLLETKSKFDLITNNGNDIICFYTYVPEGKYLYVSPNIRKILGYNYKDLLGDPRFFNTRLAGKNEEFFESEKLLKNYQKKGIVRNHHFSFKVLNAEGDEVWLENNLVPITNKKGKIEFFINILRDITEQKESDLEIKNQYLNYRNLLDNSPVAYIIHEHGVCLYANNALLKLFKLKNKNELLGKFALDFLAETDRKRALERIQQIYEERGRKSKFHNYTVADKEGNPIDVEIKSVLIKFNNRDCVLSLVNNLSEQQQREKEKLRVLLTETANKQLQKEIAERQLIERDLIEKTAHLSSILESSTHLIWTVNRKLQITSFNQNFHDVVFVNHKLDVKPGDKIDEHLNQGRQKYIEFWYAKYAEAFKGKKLEFEKLDENQNQKIYRKIFINPIYNGRGEVTEISCIANDITDSKTYEQKLLIQTGKLSAIFDSSHHYIWTIDSQEKLTSFNKNYYDLVTSLYNTKPFLGLELNRGVLANDKEYTELLHFHYAKAFAGNATSFEIETIDKDHKNIYLEIFLNPIWENGRVVEVSGIAHNITEKKHVQQRMELSLKEKEVLLREVHHRVKNNMQVISSILNLQSSYVSDDYALTLLKESQNRIKTMAYIHESLYQNKSFTSVNFSDYVYTLVHSIVQSYSYSADKIRLDLKIERVSLSLDSSIPAGLIINELITNAIKHAFPGERQGTISFGLKCIDNFVYLELKDDGAGFAPGVDFRNSHSLGLQLVNTLIDQIEGELHFKSDSTTGTEVSVKFKM